MDVDTIFLVQSDDTASSNDQSGGCLVRIPMQWGKGRTGTRIRFMLRYHVSYTPQIKRSSIGNALDIKSIIHSV